ncbi:hypothetical protein FEM33_05035 [Dyadobacter flavalbus]|uniref:Uncharacterized protein n=1 Tax=Dyadobacter flavalbus TaxID=2579942 RepID=A0A5M8R2D0_9BACT|nr:hypothetical protein [Dyadobacter flavalbus]KAA6440893.1 hypothetical protein FEM33_05035 [Dyadobacter flavalbus]
MIIAISSVHQNVVLKGMKDILESISYVVAIIGGVAGAIFYFQKKHNFSSVNFDTQFTGNLGNEGNIGDDVAPSHYVELELTATNGTVSGIANTRRLTSETQWSGLSVAGKRKSNVAYLDITHVRGGRVIYVHKFTLTLKNNNFYWKKISTEDNDFFPETATLFKYVNQTL